MEIFVRLLVGFIMVGIGTFFVLRTAVVYDFFGSLPSAEKYLGGGGTRLAYKLIGILLCLIGFIWAFNLWEVFLQATIGQLFPAPDPSEQYTP